ncbi:MAG: hypothetical protein O2856_19990 [Planctomycetota bacterium]|nr:hypothetical protein [Planctomycetota bacterium]
MFEKPTTHLLLLWLFVIGCTSDNESPVNRLDPVGQQPSRKITDSTWTAPDDSSEFVGQQACATCHSAISESYRSHAMSISMAEAAKAVPAIEDYDSAVAFTSTGGVRYEVTRHGDQVQHHEKMLDPAGTIVYDQAVDMHYAVGSGVHGRSYIHNHNGLLFMSPVTWYSGRQRWDLSPGYQAGNHRRFERRLSDDCVACHVGRANPLAGKVRPRRFWRMPLAASVVMGQDGSTLKFTPKEPLEASRKHSTIRLSIPLNWKRICGSPSVTNAIFRESDVYCGLVVHLMIFGPGCIQTKSGQPLWLASRLTGNPPKS